ncbi:hypothetical protein [Azospirillum canadense]|uniref:hypothetical protein n=1 Tax=Azospirillum canadense TaxID=403962 RepID=UPI002227A084|nr:hypothetical protein [Azospirillum canadense]MCW2240369.1 hypothetical protein [Azospirillum canadense]
MTMKRVMRRAVAAPRGLAQALGLALVAGGALLGAPRDAAAVCGDCAAATAAVFATSEVTQSLVIDTAAATNAHIAAEFSAQTAALVLALQGAAAQISGNIRGTIAGQGLLQEAVSNQDTQRLIQGDRVEAAQRFQYSTPFCQTATGSAIAVAQAAESVQTAVMRSRANANRTSGTGGGGGSAATEVNRTADERLNTFCAPDDPVCRGRADAGKRPNGDREPGAILAVARLVDDMDRKQATWVAQNLTQPVPTLPLTERDFALPEGRERYLARGAAETRQNLAKDVAADILVTRREPTADARYYNSLASEAGLPTASAVSQEDMDRMRYRDRFNANYSARVAGLGDAAPLLRELIALEADGRQQGYRTTVLLEQAVLLLGAIVSTLQEPKLEAYSGKLSR